MKTYKTTSAHTTIVDGWRNGLSIDSRDDVYAISRIKKSSSRKLLRKYFLRIFGNPNVVRRIQAPILISMLQPENEDAILDAGCGGGFLTYELARKCKMAVGIDLRIDKESPFIASKFSTISYVKGDIQFLPFVDKKFTKILLSSSLQMVQNDRMLLRECHRTLGEKGTLIVSIPVGYVYIKKLNNFRFQLKKRLGALGKGHYTYTEIMNLLKDEDFDVMALEYAPKKWGSLVYEICLLLWYRFGLPLFNEPLFPLFYLVSYIDKSANDKQKGNELLLKALRD